MIDKTYNTYTLKFPDWDSTNEKNVSIIEHYKLMNSYYDILVKIKRFC